MCKLGEGSFATVEECVLDGKAVAVKRLRPELFASERDVEMFVAEGTAIAKLDHPYVLPASFQSSLPA